MGRTSESEKIRGEFVTQMQNFGKTDGFVFKHFKYLEPIDVGFKTFKNKEIYIAVKGNQFYAVFVKVSAAIKEGFWDLSKKLFDEFQELQDTSPEWHCAIVFLKSASHGHLLSSNDFREIKPALRLVKGRYKFYGNKIKKFEFLGLDDLIKGLGLQEKAS